MGSDVSNFVNVDAGADVKGDKFNIQLVIVKQLDRLGYLMTFGTVQADKSRDFYRNALSLWQSNFYIESLLTKFLSQKYRDQAPVLKEKTRELLKIFDGHDIEFMDAWNQWFALLVNEMSLVGLLPIPEIDYYVANNDGVWDKYKEQGLDYGKIWEDDIAGNEEE